MMRAKAPVVGPLKGWHVLLMLLGFFGAVIAVNAVFVVYAVSSFPGEEEQHAYAQGVRYNDTLRERAEESRLGWEPKLLSAPKGVMRIQMSGRAGPVDGLRISAEFRRPTHAGEDFAVAFKGEGGGLYQADLRGVRPGVWEMRAVVKGAEGEILKLQQQVVLP